MAEVNPKDNATFAIKAPALPTRMILHGLEGFGKTSMGCFTPNPVFLMVGKETGLWTLMENGLVPPTPHVAKPAATWPELKAAILGEILLKNHDRKTLVVDAITGCDRLLTEWITEKNFEGSSEKFNSYGKGIEACVGEWDKILELFEQVRREKKMSIILLAHTKVATFKTPDGDYDRYTVDMHQKLWNATFKWADCVLFGQFETFIKEEKGKRAKGIGGQTRILKCERAATHDAKNRLGLPEEIDCGDGPEAAWQALATAIKKARAEAKYPPSQSGQGKE